MENQLVFSELSELELWEWEHDFPTYNIPISSYEFDEYFPSQEYYIKDDVMFDGEINLPWPEEKIKQTVNQQERMDELTGEDEMRRTKREDLDIEMLSKYFPLPINKAAKELKVGVTLLKRRCRELNIPRWPHRKMKSLDALIQNVKELGKVEGILEEGQVKATVEELEQEKRVLQQKPTKELERKTKQLRQASFKASYRRRKLFSQP